MFPNINALIGQALQNFQARNFEEAKKKLTYVLNVQPKNLAALEILGIICSNSGNLKQAVKHFEKIIKIKPDYHLAWSNRGNALLELKQYDQALASYDKAISLKPDYHSAWYNRGNALKELKQYDQALASYDKAISLKPDYHIAWSNRGNALLELKQYDQALASYDKAISLKPDYFDAYFNKSPAQLLTSDFQGGWTNYEYRWLRKEADKKHHQQFPSLTSLNDLKSSTVLVWWEQGFGDTIQFSRYLTLLANLGANVVFDVQAPLKSLLKQSFPGIRVITRDEAVSGIDFQVPLMSLPGLFSTDLSNLPSSNCYLKPFPDNLDRWRVKLNLNRDKLNIGIACSGSEAHKNDKYRSMALSYFEPLSNLANLFLIQKDLRDSDKYFLSQHPEIKFLGDQISTFEDSASIVELMDLIITVDTSLIHLSGALGKTSKVLVTWNPEWRWLLDRQDSPWYPSVKIFRQPEAGDWESVIQDVISDLKLVA